MTLQPPRTVDLFVSGRWQPPRAGQYEPATSPVTGELIGHVAQGDRADAGAAVQAAAAALGGVGGRHGLRAGARPARGR
jgi:aldehyde dehydrogenase (NAD+)